MVMVLQSVFVLDHLAVQFIDQFIYRSVHVFVRALGKHVVAFDVNIAFGLLTTLFLSLVLNAQQHLHIHHLIKMSGDSV